jgi:hypothetical protein
VDCREGVEVPWSAFDFCSIHWSNDGEGAHWFLALGSPPLFVPGISIARLPDIKEMRPAACLSPGQPGSRGHVMPLRMTISLCTACSGIKICESVKVVVVPPAGKNPCS